MTVSQLLWWAVLGWCVVTSWRAMRRADAAASLPNKAGSRILAELVVKIDTTRRFVGAPETLTVEATNTFRVRDRRFRVTVIELESADG